MAVAEVKKEAAIVSNEVRDRKEYVGSHWYVSDRNGEVRWASWGLMYKRMSSVWRHFRATNKHQACMEAMLVDREAVPRTWWQRWRLQ